MIFLKDINESNLEKVGGKAKGLFYLFRYGYLVPDFFVITPNEKINEDELNNALEQLKAKSFSIRSSALNEDGSIKSFAGQYQTFLYVKKDDVLNKINEVRASVEAANKRGYSKEESSMSVIIQRMIDPDLAGVLFTESQSSSNEIYIEMVNGVGENLVSGLKKPQSFTYKKSGKPFNELHEKLVKSALNLEKKMGVPLDIEWAYKAGILYFLQVRPLTIVDDDVPSIDINKYHLYVKHDFSLFVNSIQIEASKKKEQERLFGFSIPINDGLLINGHEFYTSNSDNAAIKVWESLDKDDFFESYIKQLNDLRSRTLAFLNELKVLNLSKLSNVDLSNKYQFFINVYLESYIPMMMRPDDYLIDKVKSLSNFSDDELNKLLYVSEPTYYANELSSFYKAIIETDFNSYLKDYEWIINPLGYELKPMTLDDLYIRAKGISKDTASKKLEEINRVKKQNVETRDQLLKTIKDNELLHYVGLLRQFVYLRTALAESSDRFFYYFKQTIIKEICKRGGISINQALLYDYKDFDNRILNNHYPDHLLNKRKRGQLVWFKDKDTKEYYGLKTYSLLKESLPDTVSDIKGQVACPGKVNGKVKIIINFLDISKMNKGDILVTSMTTPEIAGALDKASGIITDEGGVTCHAAIIAREYAIPCLVGTVNATKLLKDEMEVELDCIKGIVIIK